MPGTMVASTDSESVPPTAEPQAGAPLAAVGERMAYTVTLHGVSLAEFVMEVTGLVAVGDRDALVVEMRVDTLALASMLHAVHDRFTSWIDVGTGRPLQFHAQEIVAEAKVTEETQARFQPREYPVRLVVGDDAGTDETQVVQGVPYDFTSFLVYMRAWEAPKGSELVVDIMRSRFVWRVRIVVGERGNLVTVLGDLPVVRFEGEGVRVLRDGTVDPTSDRRRFSIWISDDADRVPVKLSAHTDYGDVLLEMASYTPGQ